VGNIESISCTAVGGTIGSANLKHSLDFVDCILSRFTCSNLVPAF